MQLEACKAGQQLNKVMLVLLWLDIAMLKEHM